MWRIDTVGPSGDLQVETNSARIGEAARFRLELRAEQ
jgi:hypothetical protein